MASVHPWTAAYLARIGLRRAPAPQKLTVPPREAATHAAVGHLDTTLVSDEAAAAALQTQYRDARRCLVHRLRTRPLSHTDLTEGARGPALHRPPDVFDLRGRSSAFYDAVATAPAPVHPAVTSAAATASRADVGVETSSTDRPSGTPAPNTAAVKGRALSWPPPATDAAVAAVVPRLTVAVSARAVSRCIAEHQSLWSAAAAFAGDAAEAGLRQDSASTSATPSPAPAEVATPSARGSRGEGSLPFRLARLPHTLVFTVAEQAIHHAWRGGSRARPEGVLRTRRDGTLLLQLELSPSVSASDVASLDWDRADAAHFLLCVLRQPPIQRKLRQRLWVAAQCCHRGVLRRLEGLAAPLPDGDGVRRISVPRESDMPAPLSLPLEALREDLFSFEEDLYYVHGPLLSRLHRTPVECRSLRSTHLFRFGSSHRDVVAAFASRPNSNLSEALSTSTSQRADARATSEAAPASHSTRDALWLLLSEMVRVRYLVAYLLHLELMLHQVRSGCAEGEGEADMRASSAETALHQQRAGEERRARELADAQCVEAVFRFLEFRVHPRLDTGAHRHRFLRLVQVLRSDVAAAAESAAREVATTTERSDRSDDEAPIADHTGPRHSTVQALYSAFTKRLSEGTARGAPPVSSASASKTAVPNPGSADVEGACKTVQDAEHAHDGRASISPLSAADKDLLDTLVAAARSGEKPASSPQHRRPSFTGGSRTTETVPATSGPTQRDSDSPPLSPHKSSESTSRISRAGSAAPRSSVVDLACTRARCDTQWPFQMLRARTSPAVLRLRCRPSPTTTSASSSTSSSGADAPAVVQQLLRHLDASGVVTTKAPLSKTALADLLDEYPYLLGADGVNGGDGEALVRHVQQSTSLLLRLSSKAPHL